MLKYIKEGYSIFDFSNCKIINNNNNDLKISFLESWPHFYHNYVYNKDIRCASQKIKWIKEEEKEENKNIFLSITLINNDNNNNNNNNCFIANNNISFGILSNNNQNDQLKFKNARDVNSFLKHQISVEEHIIKGLYLKMKNSIITLRDMLNFLAFVYNKNFTPMEMDNVENENFLIILPFIAIRSVRDGGHQFVYY